MTRRYAMSERIEDYVAAQARESDAAQREARPAIVTLRLEQPPRAGDE